MKAKSLISRVAVISGLALGAFALSAVAGSWTAPSLPPPDGNVDAPINVGSLSQSKIGLLGLVDLAVSHSFSYATSSAAAGKILSSIDSSGTAQWSGCQYGQTLIWTGSRMLCIGNRFYFFNITANPGGTPQWDRHFVVPQDVTTIRVTLYGVGGPSNNKTGGGAGGFVDAILNVVPGEEYSIHLGNLGESTTFVSASNSSLVSLSAGPGGSGSTNPGAGGTASASGSHVISSITKTGASGSGCNGGDGYFIRGARTNEPAQEGSAGGSCTSPNGSYGWVSVYF